MKPTPPLSALTQLTLDLLKIPSVTTQEARICDWIEERVRGLAPRAECTRAGNALIVDLPGTDPLPRIGLFGHLDTVAPAPDQPLGLFDGRLFGCGASDMKGGLAVMLELLAEAESFDRAGLQLVFYDREEGPAESNGLREVLSHRAFRSPDFAFCLEPTDNAVQAGCVGGLHAKVRVQGQRAHSARPWQGDNAIHRAVPLLDRISSFGDREVKVGGLSFYDVMNVTQISTANGRNVLPGEVMLNINYRFAPGKGVEKAKRELIELVRGPRPAEEFPHGLKLELIDVTLPGEVCADHPLLLDWVKRLAIPIRAKQAWTDVAKLTQAGIPAVNFGPGESAQAHQARESLSPEMLEANYRMLMALFVDDVG